MTIRWHFNRQRPGDLSRNPTGSEFFAIDALKDDGEAFVREALQNSLDAGGGRKVRVRIMTSGMKCAASSEDVAPFFQGLWEHLRSEGSRLPGRINQSDPVPYLVLEDFGTSGLIGDVRQPYPERNVTNHFVHFFRGEGFSDKGDKSAGRWGLGKNVFPKSSSAATFFGLTVREDDGAEYLMGRCILPPHAIGSKRFNPDGFFGIPPTDGEDGLVLPLDDKNSMDAFRKVFGLRRTPAEPGLSIVVPWYDQADLNKDSILVALLRHYFWPILKGLLEVEIEAEGAGYRVDAASLPDLLKSESLANQHELSALIDLARDAMSMLEENFVRVPLTLPVNSHKWDLVRLEEQLWTPVRERFEAEEMVGFRCPVWIREQTRDKVELPVRKSHFDVFLRRTSLLKKGTTVFIRDVLTVPDVRPPRTRNVVALVVIKDEPLKELLGASENPAHTQWQTDARQEDGRRFKDRYVFGPAYLRFVIQSADELVKILTSMDRAEDQSLLADMFSLPPDPEDDASATRKPKKKDQPGGESDPEPSPDPKAKERGFRIAKLDGGFVVSSVGSGSERPSKLRVLVAYHCRSGNPFKRFKPWDFDMDKGSEIKLKLIGLSIEKKTPNELVLRILSPEFRLEAAGFDSNRDLRVSVTAKEAAYGDQNA